MTRERDALVFVDNGMLTAMTQFLWWIACKMQFPHTRIMVLVVMTRDVGIYALLGGR